MSVGDLSWWSKLEREEWVRRLPIPRPKRPRRIWLWLCAGIALTLAAIELNSSWLQSRVLATLATRLHFHVGKGPSASYPTAPTGPYDLRMGYSQIPSMVSRLGNSFRVTEQASSSFGLRNLSRIGSYAIYPEKAQGGLSLVDRDGQPLFQARYPREVYAAFDAIPPLVVQTLLYIENRKVLDDGSPYNNPAVEWNRLAKAMGDLALNKVYKAHPITGGSTLATQLEKVRHSEAGRTSGTGQKFEQMFAASLRAYRNGANTTLIRRDIVRDYINSFPLGAIAGYGEVTGLQEGLFAWFGADPAEVNRLLSGEALLVPADVPKQALAYRQVLSLLLALNRPSYYLRDGKAALDERVDSYLRLFKGMKTIAPQLADAALRAKTKTRDHYTEPGTGIDKSALALRAELLSKLGVPNTYALDRMDLTVNTTLDGAVQQNVSQELRAISDPAYAMKVGLGGHNLLGPQADGSVIYSLTVYERGDKANVLRVESDNYKQPLNINRGTRLELGSTAKLRTLVTYLEIVTSLHEKYRSASPAELERARTITPDPITVWAIEYLTGAQDRSLAAMLEAAMDRKYSASTSERFFTAGGLHTFSNFNRADNGAIMPVRTALRNSVNLVFVRMMRDIKEYFEWRLPSGSPRVLEDATDPLRRGYLERFADQESQTFLERYWSKYRGQPDVEGLKTLAAQSNANLRRLTVIYRSVYPDASVEQLGAFLRTNGRITMDDKWVKELFEQYDPAKFSWGDLGYLASVHPLELWTLRYKHEHPDGTYAQAVQASQAVRRDSYEWLFKKGRPAQNTRISTILEQDAFRQVLASWKRQGYPFETMVASYASALGSSGDNPAALSELAGIILNDGVKKPSLRIERLHMAEGTPYETALEASPSKEERLYPVELARVVKTAMFDVVENGTARRAYGSLKENGKIIPIGGKTGTGDNRVETYGRGGSVKESRATSRTATFVFLIGDRFFGTITAYVPGAKADNFSFTSALPAQLFKHLAPKLEPLLKQTSGRQTMLSTARDEIRAASGSFSQASR